MMFESWYLGMKCCCVERVVGGMACLLLLECPKAALRFHLNFHFHRVRAIFSTCLTRRPPSYKLPRYTHPPLTPLRCGLSCRRCAFLLYIFMSTSRSLPIQRPTVHSMPSRKLQSRFWRSAATWLRKDVVSTLTLRRDNKGHSIAASSPRWLELILSRLQRA